ncbi:alpha/beta hydrolase [Pseudonocardiaceae bacterium YIM PH 21723]|nr:alpha/beta hydrolase [Pseudonocardiaceae bacterium YIM PH 21723]
MSSDTPLDATGEIRVADGTVLNLAHSGEATAPVTVLLVHGYALDHRSWHHQLSDLPEATGGNARVLAYDQRGHGASGPANGETATIEQLGDDLAEVIEKAAPTGTIVLVGHSMGALACLALAERRPRLFKQRVGGLVMLSTVAKAFGETALAWPQPVGKLVQGLEEIFGSRVVRAVRERITPAKTKALRWLIIGDQISDEDAELSAEMVWSHWPDTIALFRPAFDRYDRTASTTVVADSGVPVTALVGEKDRLCPASHAAAMVKACGGGEAVVLPGVGHMPQLERAADITEHIVARVKSSA